MEGAGGGGGRGCNRNVFCLVTDGPISAGEVV